MRLDNKSYSVLTWNVISRSLIKDLFNSFLKANAIEIESTLVTEYEMVKGYSSLCLEFRSPNIFFHTNTDRYFKESNAKLIYSMNVDGSVAVILYPHKSEIHRSKLDHYLIDMIENSAQIASQVGRSRINKHLKRFKLISDITNVRRHPQKQDLKAINKLLKTHKKFSSLYENYAEERKVSQQADIAFGTGLAGGLIASSIVPMLISFGDSSRALSAKDCDLLCEFAAKNFTPGWIVIIAILVLIVVIFKIRSVISE